MVSDRNIRVCVERLCQRAFSQEEEDVDGGALGGWREGEGEGEAKVGGSRTPRLANMQRRHQGHTHKHKHTHTNRERVQRAATR